MDMLRAALSVVVYTYEDERVGSAEGQPDAGHEPRHGGEVEEVAEAGDSFVRAQGIETLALPARRLLRDEVADPVPFHLVAQVFIPATAKGQPLLRQHIQRVGPSRAAPLTAVDETDSEETVVPE